MTIMNMYYCVSVLLLLLASSCGATTQQHKIIAAEYWCYPTNGLNACPTNKNSVLVTMVIAGTKYQITLRDL
jgi:hypothetical protein